MADTHGLLKIYLKETLSGASVDLTTLLRKRADALTSGDLNQKIKAILASAGASN